MTENELENLRLSILKKNKIINIIFIIIAIISFLILLININNLPSKILIIQFTFITAVFCIAISFVVKGICTGKQKSIFTNEYKNTFVEAALKKVFSDLSYEPNKGLDREVIRSTQMMSLGDVYRSSDYLEGKYKNTTVIGADVHIQVEQRSTDRDGHTTTTYITVFLGKWLVFDFNKSFKSDLQVIEKGFGNAIIDRWGADKRIRVKFEDENFNDKFYVYAQKEHEAFYLLTPNFIKRLEDLNNKLDGGLMLCFVDNHLHVGLNNRKDSFEPNYRKKVDSVMIENEINKEIKIITDFVDELDLSNDLFKEVKK